MDAHFSPKPGRIGTQPAFLHIPLSATITANATTTLATLSPGRKVKFSRITYTCTTLAADADGTVLATAYKRRASDDASVAVTAAVDLEAMTVSEGTTAINSAADADALFAEADAIVIKVVNNSAAINTQPVGLAAVVEFLVIE